MIARLDEIFTKANKLLIGWSMIILVTIVFLNVITRYVYGFSLSWAEEIARFLMIGICFVGAGLALRQRRHVSIEILLDLIKNPKWNKGLRIINGVIILIFMAALFYLGIKYSIETFGQESMVLRWNMGLIYLLIPFGALTFIMHLILMFKDFIQPINIEGDTEEEMPMTRNEGSTI